MCPEDPNVSQLTARPPYASYACAYTTEHIKRVLGNLGPGFAPALEGVVLHSATALPMVCLVSKGVKHQAVRRLGTYRQEGWQQQRAVAQHQKLVRIDEAHPRVAVSKLVDADVVDLHTSAPKAVMRRRVQVRVA
jgi:hypothetical protein